MICTSLAPRRCPQRQPAAMLAAAVALFKTPSLRDLGHSAPYFHNGSRDALEDVVAFYQRQGDLARRKQLRNGAAALSGVSLRAGDLGPLAAFLRALNEDFE
jgi:cytochrome c peroxidase